MSVDTCSCNGFYIAAFDYEFGALDNADNELSAVYKNLLLVVFELSGFFTHIA